MRPLPAVLALMALLTLGCFVKDRVVPPSVDTARPDFPDTAVTDDTGDTEPEDSPAPSWVRYEYNFDELEQIEVDNHYEELQFAVEDGQHMVSFAAASLARSQPNCLYVGSSPGAAGSTAAFTLSFLRPVRDLRFFHSGDSVVGEVAEVELTLESGEPVVLSLTADGDAYSSELADLSAYEGVTSVQVRGMTDPNGLAYDDLSFEMRDR